MENAIAGTDVGEEGVSKSLTWVSPLYKTSNVHNIQESRNLTEIYKQQDKQSVRFTDSG